MFKKIMAKFGIGAASVDLRLDRDGFRLGEEVTGTIHIEGGAVEQSISQLSVLLVLKAQVKGQSVSRTVATIPVLKSFTVGPKPFVQEVPFRYLLPHDLAISSPSIGYHLQTVLDVELAVDPTDLDRIEVLPSVPVHRTLQALERLDLRHKPDSGKLTRCGQEFAFFPGRPFSQNLRELEVIFYEGSEGLRLLIELDVMQGTLFRHERETKAEILIPNELLADDSVEKLSQFLHEKIEFFLNNPQAIPYVPFSRYGGPGSYYSGGHGSHAMGSLMGAMAVGLIGSVLLSEIVYRADELAEDSLIGDDEGIFTDDDDDSGDYDSGDDGGDFGGFDE
ncbi:MAG: sporulation protein [Clostridia bacterium]